MPPLLITALLDWRTWAFVAVIAASTWLYHSGVTNERHRWEVKTEKALAARRAAVSEFVVAMSGKNAELQAELATERGKIKTETVTLIKEVANYVTPLADSRCVVPVGFVQHHNAAWGMSAFPPAVAGLVDQPSGIPLSRVESVSTENAGTCKEWRAEALAARKWYRVNKEKYDAFAGATATKPETVPKP